MDMKIIKLYDFDTQLVTEIPMSELAPGYIRVTVAGVGEVFVRSDSAKESEVFRHPPLDAGLKKLMRDFSKLFRDVYPRTSEQWEDGFRRDTHPEREIEIWANIGGAFNHFTRGKKLNIHEKRDVFGIIMSCFNNGPDAALECYQPEALSRATAQQIVSQLREGKA
jgi:hypothetical protein